MNEIIPDTSKYTDLPNRLRAMALILELNSDIQWRCGGAWETIGVPRVSEIMNGLKSGFNYRSKPKPRELWKLAIGSDYFLTDYPTRELAEAALSSVSALYTLVRFVEQPE